MKEDINYTADTSYIKPISLPKYVGGYYNKDLKIMYQIEQKPPFLHRFFTNLLLGFKWEDK